MFWKAKSIIHVDYLESKKTITGAYLKSYSTNKEILSKKRVVVCSGDEFWFYISMLRLTPLSLL